MVVVEMPEEVRLLLRVRKEGKVQAREGRGRTRGISGMTSRRGLPSALGGPGEERGPMAVLLVVVVAVVLVLVWVRLVEVEVLLLLLLGSEAEERPRVRA